MIERSKGKLRADRAHEKLLGLGYAGSERTTRRAVAAVKRDYRLGRVRVHRPWVTEPGMWLQYDFGDGPVIDGVKTTLFIAWLAWSRFPVVLPIRDKTMPSVMAALDVTVRRLGGAPTYVLTDNEKTVTTEHIAGPGSLGHSRGPKPPSFKNWPPRRAATSSPRSRTQSVSRGATVPTP